MNADARAFVCGCAGLDLTSDERRFIAGARPWGLILFKRNIGDRTQVARLTRSFRELVGRADAPVLVDQEGGRVQRLGPPHWPKYPPAAAFDRLTGLSIEEKQRLVWLSARLMAADLHAVGISVDCLPVLDVPAAGGHAIIGDRAYCNDPQKIARFGRAAAEGLLAGALLPVMKHLPGHGRAAADSHLELPIVAADRASLETVDFVPFRALSDLPIAMTAHVVYTALDPDRPATTSRRVVAEVIRAEIGFDGLLLSDDLSMRALSGGLGERAAAAFSAGVDVALHCNGDLVEAQAVAAAAPFLAGKSLARAAAALALIAADPEPFDPVDASAALQSALAGTGESGQSTFSL
jgi:beta-N-acetylhexosaminidase